MKFCAIFNRANRGCKLFSYFSTRAPPFRDITLHQFDYPLPLRILLTEPYTQFRNDAHPPSVFRISHSAFRPTSVTFRPNICHFFKYLSYLQQTDFTRARRSPSSRCEIGHLAVSSRRR